MDFLRRLEVDQSRGEARIDSLYRLEASGERDVQSGCMRERESAFLGGHDR